MIVNSSQGGGSKDTWVLADEGAHGGGAPARSGWARPRMPDLRTSGWSGQQQVQQQ